LARAVREAAPALPAAPVPLALLPAPVSTARAARDAGGLVAVDPSVAGGPARLPLLLLRIRHGGGRGRRGGCGGRHFSSSFLFAGLFLKCLGIGGGNREPGLCAGQFASRVVGSLEEPSVVWGKFL